MSTTNQAKRKYTQGIIGVMTAYMGFVFFSTFTVHHWHPQGWHLILAAGFPTLPILCLAFIVGRYLREEKDEYQRDVTIRGLLWGTAVALVISVFSGFLRSYGSTVEVPPFTVFVAFWITVAIVRAIHTLSNRGGDDE